MQLPAFPQEGDLLRRGRRGADPALAQQHFERLQILALDRLPRRGANHRAIDFEQPQRRRIDRLDLSLGSERDDAGRDPLEDGLDVLAPLVELHVLPLEIDARALELALAVGQLPRHRVERLDELTEFVARLRFDTVVEMAGADLPRAGREPLDRPRDALGEIEPGPRRADENHQRHHHEEREVDALQRPPHRRQLAAILESLDDLPGVARRLAGQIVAREDDADEPACRRRESRRRRGRAPHRLRAAPGPGTRSSLRRRARPCDRRSRAVDRRAAAPATPPRAAGHGRRHPRLLPDAIDLDQADAALRDLGLDRFRAPPSRSPDSTAATGISRAIRVA